MPPKVGHFSMESPGQLSAKINSQPLQRTARLPPLSIETSARAGSLILLDLFAASQWRRDQRVPTPNSEEADIPYHENSRRLGPSRRLTPFETRDIVP